MPKFINIFIGLSLVWLAGCAAQEGTETASATTTSGQATQAESALSDASGNDPDEMICRREEVTGTNFRRRICMTRAERDSVREASQQKVLDNRSAQRNL